MQYDNPVYRPPGEWRSFILQATIGCSHNNCTFCGMYKGKKFRLRPLDEILSDIDEQAAIFNRYEKIFIADGDATVIPTGQLVAILERLRERFPMARLISSYAGPKPTLAKKPEELKALREAGLGRCYLGIETGSDAILKSTKKGVDAAQMLEAGLKLKEAGIDLWGIILIGLGGRAGSEEHIDSTIELLNKMQPDHISAMNYTPVSGTELGDEVDAGRFEVLSAEESLLETKRLLSGLKLSGCHFTSDHASNYLPLKGTISEESAELCALIDRALSGSIGIRSEYSRGL